jgi:tight adherence protein C
VYEIVIPVVVFLTVVGIGSAILIPRASKARRLHSRIHGTSDPSSMKGADGPNLVDTLTQIGRVVAKDQPQSALRSKLMQAGYHNPSAPIIYLGAQLFLVLVGIAIAVPVVLLLDMPAVIGVCIGFILAASIALLPNFVVDIQRLSRQRKVRLYLPDAIDLLEICVSSGMGLDTAWNAVGLEVRNVSSVLADEMALANLELHLGIPRADALRRMASRTGVPEISSLVATLVQSERFGTSVSPALRIYADALRTERSQRAEEAAEKLMVKLLFPMLVFIFPVLFIVILGPAGIKIMDIFSNMSR